MLLANPVYGEDIWEQVEQWNPANLSEFTGVYVSDEAEVALRVELQDARLVIHRRPTAPSLSVPLTPTRLVVPLATFTLRGAQMVRSTPLTWVLAASGVYVFFAVWLLR